MKILIAPDSFKGSLSSAQVCAVLQAGLKNGDPSLTIETLPMADGGEHSLDCVLSLKNAYQVSRVVQGPYGQPVPARYALIDDTAVLEMAQSSGLMLPNNRRDPLKANTFGFGELLLDALDRGFRKFVLFLGGSATNDGGAGMAAALGVRYFRGNQLVEAIPEKLEACDRVDCSGLDPRLKECQVILACDVENPLLGKNGASAVFGPQKGATLQDVQRLDTILERLADLSETAAGKRCRDLSGAGAAGGLGFGLMCFLNAQTNSGIDTMIQLLEFEAKAKTADLIITGEGCTDAQTAFGKTPLGIAKAAKKYGKPVIVISGALLPETYALNELGIDALFGCVQHCCSTQEALDRAEENLFHCARNIAVLLKLGNIQRSAANA